MKKYIDFLYRHGSSPARYIAGIVLMLVSYVVTLSSMLWLVTDIANKLSSAERIAIFVILTGFIVNKLGAMLAKINHGD